MDYLIGADIGTTSVKSIAVGMKGIVLAEFSQNYTLHHPQSGYYEQDPEEVFQALISTLQEVVQTCSDDKLIGISFSTAMHSLIAIDDQHVPLTKMITWADTRSQSYAQQLLDDGKGKRIYEATGTPIYAMSPLCKIAWIKEQEPDIFKNTYKFISIKEYIWKKLTHKYEVDHSIASATGLMDIHKLTWSPLALDYLGISEEKLSYLVSSTHIHVGMVQQYAQMIGIPDETPLIIGASDGCLANLGTGSIKHDEATVTIGTSGAMRMFAKRPTIDPHMRLFCYMLDEEYYLVGGAINNGGKALEWFMKQFEPEISDWNAFIENVLDTVPPGSEGLICLPYLMGERSPHWDAHTRGTYIGLRSVHTSRHFARSLMEGIVFSMYQVGLALAETNCPYHKIYVSGGFARSHPWVQMLTDVFDTAIGIPDTVQSSALGAVFLAMKALKKVDAYEDLPFNLNLVHEFQPNAEKHKVYMPYFDIYKDLYPLLKQDFLRLNQLIT